MAMKQAWRRSWVAKLALASVLVFAACAGTQPRAESLRMRVDSGLPWHERMGRGGNEDLRFPGSALPSRRAFGCDAFDRCERVGPANVGPGFRYLYGGRRELRSPGWYAPSRGDDRFVKTRSNVRCDRATRICYKRGRVDKSETEDLFGERAGDRADGLRDSLGTSYLFVTRGGAACDRDRRVCFENGEPDRDLTERFFGRHGKKAHD